jgi:hypothetical protein
MNQWLFGRFVCCRDIALEDLSLLLDGGAQARHITTVS